LLQRHPSLETSSCAKANPCTQQYIDRFNYISEPLLALTAAITILTLLLIQKGMPALQMLVWAITAAITLAILLWVNSDAWAIALLPVAVYVVMTALDRRNNTVVA
jgi:hypothetical protein